MMSRRNNSVDTLASLCETVALLLGRHSSGARDRVFVARASCFITRYIILKGFMVSFDVLAVIYATK